MRSTKINFRSVRQRGSEKERERWAEHWESLTNYSLRSFKGLNGTNQWSQESRNRRIWIFIFWTMLSAVHCIELFISFEIGQQIRFKHWEYEFSHFNRSIDWIRFNLQFSGAHSISLISKRRWSHTVNLTDIRRTKINCICRETNLCVCAIESDINSKLEQPTSLFGASKWKLLMPEMRRSKIIIYNFMNINIAKRRWTHAFDTS